jgi:hypothetical protein
MVGSYSKHWACLFPQHGAGMKHTRTIALQAWQEETVAARTEHFVRGLIHSDGCRTTNRVRRSGKDGDRWHEYPRYFFTNASDDIRLLFADALDRLGIDWRQARHLDRQEVGGGATGRIRWAEVLTGPTVRA